MNIPTLHQSANPLPGIKSICVVRSADLVPSVEHRGNCGLPVTVIAGLRPIEFCGEATVEVTTERVGRLDIETAVLKFNAARWDSDTAMRGYAYVITTPAGDNWLLGRREAPGPLVKYSRATGSPSGDAAVCSFEIKYTALKALVQCRAIVP